MRTLNKFDLDAVSGGDLSKTLMGVTLGLGIIGGGLYLLHYSLAVYIVSQHAGKIIPTTIECLFASESPCAILAGACSELTP